MRIYAADDAADDGTDEGYLCRLRRRSARDCWRVLR